MSYSPITLQLYTFFSIENSCLSLKTVISIFLFLQSAQVQGVERKRNKLVRHVRELDERPVAPVAALQVVEHEESHRNTLERVHVSGYKQLMSFI